MFAFKQFKDKQNYKREVDNLRKLSSGLTHPSFIQGIEVHFLHAQ